MRVPTSEVVQEVTMELTPEVRLATILKGEMTRQELQYALGLRNANHFHSSYIQSALDAGLIEMTLPDKPRSSRNKYRRATGKVGPKARDA